MASARDGDRAELDDLVRPPDGGPALIEEEQTVDPFGHPFVYELGEDEEEPRVMCLGADGVRGGYALNADFGPRGGER